ncbi:MAG TPA: YciI family protein [Mesorhizobium sp.]|jgi:hypothetical protein|nr:YciI family protein [Mesorhizobium sp.]
MLVAFIAKDRSQGLALRMETRPAHIAFLERLNAEGKLTFAGPFLDSEGKPDGSLVVVNAGSLDEAKAMLAEDPYAKAGLFEFTDFRAWNWAFNRPDGLAP